MDDRRTSAVIAYCRELCGPERAEAAAREVDEALRGSNGGGEAALLQTMRRVALPFSDLRGLHGEWRTLLEEVRDERGRRAFRATLSAAGAAPAEAAPPIATDAVAPAVPQTPAPLVPPDTPPVVPPPAGAAAGRRGLVVFPAGAAARATTRPARPPTPAGRAPRVRPALGRPRIALPTAGLLGLIGQYRVFLTTLALGAVVVVIVALTIGGGSSTPTASLPPPSPASAALPAAPAPPAVHRRRPVHHAVHHVHTTRTTTTAAVTPTTSTSSPAVSQTPASSTPTTHSSPSGGVVATQQNSSLPAQTAPTQTVGSGSTTP